MMGSFARCRIVVLAAAIALLLASCAEVSRFVDSAEPYHTDAYEKALDRWSREVRIHRGLEVVLIASATFRSEGFRRAYADEYAQAHRLTPEEGEKFLEDQLHALGLGHEFLMASFVPEKRWNDFDKGKSTWKLYLLNDHNERLEPVEVRKLKGQDAVLSHFFPYITAHKSVYAVRFAFNIPGTSRPFFRGGKEGATLVIASVLGTAEMHWESDQTILD